MLHLQLWFIQDFRRPPPFSCARRCCRRPRRTPQSWFCRLRPYRQRGLSCRRFVATECLSNWNPPSFSAPGRAHRCWCTRRYQYRRFWNYQNVKLNTVSKTRENVVVLDFLAVDNFDFTRKIVKKIWGEKLVKMSKLNFWTKIWLLE